MPNLALLILGLIPPAYLITLISRYGIPEALSLRAAGIMFPWVGYHLSPWLFFITGKQWDTFLLVPAYIDTALIFSTVSSFGFLIGYSYFFCKKLAIERSNRSGDEGIRVSPRLVVFLAAIVLGLLVVWTGGLAELWSATTYRGEGQFDERTDVADKMRHVIAVIRTPITIALIVASGFLILNSNYSRSNFWVGHFGLLVASLYGFYHFSRAAGFPLILVAFLVVRFKKRMAMPYALLLVCMALFMGSVGLEYRGMFRPGVGNYLVAVTDALLGITGGGARSYEFSTGFVNPLDATAAFTRVVELGAPHEDHLSTVFKFFWNLNPLPSEFVPLFPIGEDLASAMGTWGRSGLTTPAFGELYRVFGYWGTLGMLVVGMLCGWCERRAVVRPSMLSSLNVLLFFAAFPLGLHSAMRAMTRPFVYGAVMLFASRFRWGAATGKSKLRATIPR